MLISGIAVVVRGLSGETGDGGRRLVVSKPVQNRCETSKRHTNHGSITCVMVVAECSGDVVQSSEWVTMFGLESTNSHRED